ETEFALRRCRKAFILPNERASLDCIAALGPETVSLDHLYLPLGKPRAQVYQDVADVVLAAARAGPPVAFACEGHPLIYVTPSRLIIEGARETGLHVTVLPAVSSLDTLFVDLGLDPGTTGLQVYEATTAMLYGYELQP